MAASWLLASLVLSFSAAACSSGTLISLSYDYSQEGNIVSPYALVEFAVKHKIPKVFVSDSNPKVLKALAGTGIQVGVGVSERGCRMIGNSSSSASSWLKKRVMGFLPITLISSIVVGPVRLEAPETSDLVSNFKAINGALVAAKLDKQIKIVPLLPSNITESLCFLPNQSVLSPLLQFVSKTSSFLMLSTQNFDSEFGNKKHLLSSVIIPAGKQMPPLGCSSTATEDIKSPFVSAVIMKPSDLELMHIKDLKNGELEQVFSTPRMLMGKKSNNTSSGLKDSLVDTFPTPPYIPYTNPNTPMTNSPATPVGSNGNYPFTSPTVPTFAPTTPFTPPTTTTPFTPPTTTTPAGAAAGSWCVAKPGVPDQSLQVALDYACGLGGADCAPIQPAGSCYNPNTVAAHASYAFDSYYKRNGMAPGSCDFGGNAMISYQDPSSGTCAYSASVGAGSSVLNTSIPGSGGGLGGMTPDTNNSMLLCAPFIFTLLSLFISFLGSLAK